MRPCSRASRARVALVAAFTFAIGLHASTAHAALRFQTRFSGQIANRSNTYLTAKIAIADLNGDGDLDVVAPGARYGVDVLLGRGDGTLAPPLEVGSTGSTAFFITVADFDGDGHLDIGEASYSEIAIDFGDGTGEGWQRAALPLNGQALEVVACDVDGDGHTDLVSLVSHEAPLGAPPNSDPPEIRSYLSRPGRTFTVLSDPQPLLTLTPVGFEARDLNGDGKADLVVTGRAGSAGVCIGLGHGDGTFTFTGRSDSFGDAYGCELADATGDGKIDVIIASSFGMTLYPGAGDGTFGAPQSFYQPGWLEGDRDVALADVTGDGVADLVTSDYSYDDLVVRPGLGAGAWGAPQRHPFGCLLLPMELADLNGDGVLDVVGLSTNGDRYDNPPGVFVALGDGAGGFGAERPGATYTNAGPRFPCVAGDFDGDGWIDLASVHVSVPGSTAQVLRNAGGREFTPRPATLIPDQVTGAFAADLDEDGRLDLVTVATNGFFGGSAAAQWLRGLGDGTFAAPAAMATGGFAILGVKDVTEDGHADLVLQTSGLRILPGLGNGTFGTPFDIPNPGWLRLVVADVDGDSHPDFVLSGGPGTAILHGPFFEGMPIVAESWIASDATSSAAGDFDGDGRVDLVSVVRSNGVGSSFLGTVEARRHLPDGTFDAPVVSTWPGSALYDVKLVDLDQDGDLDLLGLSEAGWYVGIGDGAGHFTIEGLEASGALMISPTPDPIDFDGDGRLDLVVNEYSDNTPSIEVSFGRDPNPPVVSNVALQSGAPLPIGSARTLGWTASDDVGLGTATVFVSRHGAAGPFAAIGTTPAADGAFGWTVAGPPCDSITFKVVVRDLDGNTAWAKSARTSIVSPTTAVVEGASRSTRLALSARTNPAHGALGLELGLPRAGHATLSLLDVQGRRVATLFDGELPAGTTLLDRARPGTAGAGLYFVRLDCGGEHAVARIALTP